ncbi:MAG: MFS transporter [Panacagrimonas sp.]
MTGTTRIPDRPGLVILCVAAFISMAAMRACDPLLPLFASSFGVSTGEAAQTISFFAVAYGFMQLVYGPLGDRYGKFRMITFAVAGCAVGNAMAVMSGDFQALVIARAVSGAMAAGIIPMSLAWVGDSVPYESRQEVLAYVMTATLLGTASGQWASGLLAEHLGWRWMFGLLSGLFVVVALRMWVMRSTRGARSEAPPSGSFFRGTRAVLSTPWARTVLAFTALEGAFAFSVFAFVPAYLHDAFGLSLNAAAAVAALFALSGLVYTARARFLIARLGEPGLVLGGASLLGLSCLLIAFAPNWMVAVPACAAAGLGFAMLHSTLQAHATQMAPEQRGTAVSMFGASLFFGQSLGVASAAYSVDHLGFRSVFVTAGLVIVPIGLAFSRSLSRRAVPMNRIEAPSVL